MIGRLTGRVAECAPDRLLLDVSGVGYRLRIPLGTYYWLSEGANAPVTLHIHTHVREDALELFGFASPEERDLFEVLIGISGIGPRIALAILSGIGATELRSAVRNQDHARLVKIPGVGRKTAERLLLELRDRLDLERPTPPGRPVPGGRADGEREDAISALQNLGYPRDPAERAVDRALAELGPAAKLEAVLRTALRGLVRA